MRDGVGEIYLWWIGVEAAERRLLDTVGASLTEVYGIPVRRWDHADRPTDAYDPRRQQHSSSGILRWLLDRRPPRADRLLGVTDVDLFIPILTFVYGEAQLGGAGALVSTARLREPRDSSNVVLQRIVKECVHELGHTFGLLHCPNPRCVMARSVSVLNVDAKDVGLCADCRTRYEAAQQGNDSDE